MKTQSKVVLPVASVLLLAFSLQPLAFIHASPLGTAFTYQGRLNAGANPATGTFDFRFTLADSASEGSAVAGPLTNAAVAVSNGLFAVVLDFGSSFDGNARWLEIGVRTNGATEDFTTLAPRQPLTPSPYALYSSSAGSAQGVAAGSVTAAGIAAGTITADKLATSQVVKTLNGLADDVTIAAGSNATVVTSGSTITISAVPATVVTNTGWGISGNAGTTAGANFLGTTDNQPLELKVNGQRALRLEPNPNGAALIVGATNNSAFADGATIAGGFGNSIQSNASYSIIGGGYYNLIQSSNAATAPKYDFIGGGALNTIEPYTWYGSIPGGYGNRIQYYGLYASIAGGFWNLVGTNAQGAAIGGGRSNAIAGYALYATIPGGVSNTVSASYGAIGGGWYNTIEPGGYYGAIAGGVSNRIQYMGDYTVIAGGLNNLVGTNASNSAIAGGQYNTISNQAQYAAIPGGSSNTVGASYALAAGQRAKANHTGSFVWADSQGADFPSTANNQFLVRAAGGVGINKYSPATALDVNGTVTATTFSGSGASLYSLNANNLASGTVSDSRLSANIPRLGSGQTFSGANLFSGTLAATNTANQLVGAFSGDGAGLSNIPAASLTGTLATAQLPGSVVTNNAGGITLSGTFSGNGAGLTNLSLPGPSPYTALLNTNQIFTASNTFAGVLTATNGTNFVVGAFSGNGAGLSNIPAASLIGTLGTSQLPASVVTNNAGGITLSGTFSGNGAGLTNLNVPGPSPYTALLNTNQLFTASNTFAGVLTATNGTNFVVGAFSGNGVGLSNIPAASLTGTLVTAQLPAPVVTNNAGSITLSGTFSGNGGGLTNVWLLGGNANTSPTANYLGTSDNQPLELRVNGTRALRLEPTMHGPPNMIGGGPGNDADAASTWGATIGGANNQMRDSSYATIVGGTNNQVGEAGSATIAGGNYNHVFEATSATIAGGDNNELSGLYTFIGGGWYNAIEPGNAYNAIGGGSGNVMQTYSQGSVIAGGISHLIGTNAHLAAIGGGCGNTISNDASFAIIPGGRENTAGGPYAFAAGRQAKANHQGTFVWGDSQDIDVASTGANQFLVRAAGGVGINTNNPQTALHVNGTVTAAAFSGSGAALTGMNASQLTAGTVPLPQLPTAVVTNNAGGVSLTGTFSGNGAGLTNLSVSGPSPYTALLNTNQVFTATNIFAGQVLATNPASQFAGDGGGLTNLQATGITGGTLSLKVLPSSVLTNNATGVHLTGSFSGNGAGMTNVNLLYANSQGGITWSQNPSNGLVVASSLGVGLNPYALVVADMNRDGNPDLVCASVSTNILNILTNDGHGCFGLSAQLRESAISVAAADLNADGKLDLICAQFAEYPYNNLKVLTNNGSGGFGLDLDFVNFSTDMPSSVTAADINGDGKVDVICASTNNSLIILTNNGSGRFADDQHNLFPPITLPVGGCPLSVAAADLNGDGKVDLTTANYHDDSLSVLINDGGGIFHCSATLTVGNHPVCVIAADVNGDGWPDLVSANCWSSTLSVLTNTGSGSFVLATWPPVGPSPVSVVAADINGDGRMDLITADGGSTRLTVVTNNGSGGFPVAAELYFGGYPQAVVAADLNRDGTIDLATAAWSLDALVIFTNGQSFTAHFTGDGSGITGLNASELASGTVPLDRLPGEVVTNYESGVVFEGLTTADSLSVPGTNRVNVLFVTNNLATYGNAGIGTLNPAQRLEVNGRIRMDTWTPDATTAVYRNASGDLGLQSSDLRLKRNVQTISNALEVVAALRGVTFNWLAEPEGAPRTAGLVAQEVRAAMPELTFQFQGADGETYLGVHYEKVAAVLVNAVQQQQAQIEDLNARLEKLERMLAAQPPAR
jgi:hypothetical protein